MSVRITCIAESCYPITSLGFKKIIINANF